MVDVVVAGRINPLGGRNALPNDTRTNQSITGLEKRP